MQSSFLSVAFASNLMKHFMDEEKICDFPSVYAGSVFVAAKWIPRLDFHIISMINQ